MLQQIEVTGIFWQANGRTPPNSNCVAFSSTPAQIGDASAGSDYFCAVIGPAAERARRCSGLRPAGRPGTDGAGRKNPAGAGGDPGAAAGCYGSAIGRRGRALV